MGGHRRLAAPHREHRAHRGGGDTTKLVVDMTRTTHTIFHIGTKGIGGK
nr:hypothetical protein OG999_11110 [Streptomyces sp. NBC_00886]